MTVWASRPVSTLSLDRLDDTTLLLQTALTTCIRAKERRIAWLCRICLDSEVTSCPICRKKILDRHLLILLEPLGAMIYTLTTQVERRACRGIADRVYLNDIPILVVKEDHGGVWHPGFLLYAPKEIKGQRSNQVRMIACAMESGDW
eukprot:SM000101S09297  [mRNA]  locus=s101:478314:480398:+ [translate_table: standard]